MYAEYQEGVYEEPQEDSVNVAVEDIAETAEDIAEDAEEIKVDIEEKLDDE